VKDKDMELTGDLSDFALADILQIMALSRKTGTILLESGEQEGRILLQQGKVIHASTTGVESLGELITRRRGISGEILQGLIDIGSRSEGVWAFDTLIIESGILGDRELKADVRSHIRLVLGSLLGLHKGQFNIVLNRVVVPEPYKEVVLPSGLDVSEVLIDAARQSDELKRIESGEGMPAGDVLPEGLNEEESNNAPSDNVSNLFESTILSKKNAQVNGNGTGNGLGKGHNSDRLSRFCSLLSELNGKTSESEITLMLMRYASELVSRGILFAVGKTELNGLGQFGLTSLGGISSRNSDLLVRNMKIPLSGKCLLSSIVKTPRPTIEKIQRSRLAEELLSAIGGNDGNLTVLVVPLVCEGRVPFLLYGDNFPDEDPIEGIEELFVFAHLASMVLEKIKLEERMYQLKDRFQLVGVA
jgi:Domain of unknown function (DUF4388)